MMPVGNYYHLQASVACRAKRGKGFRWYAFLSGQQRAVQIQGNQVMIHSFTTGSVLNYMRCYTIGAAAKTVIITVDNAL